MRGTPTPSRVAPQRKEVDLSGRYLIGIIKDDIDPDNLSRVKVFFPSIQTEENSEFYWCTVLRPVLRGSSDKAGWANIPRKDSKVLVVFDGGNLESGVVIGEITTGQNRSKIETGNPDVWGYIDENGTMFMVDVKNGDLKIFHKESQVHIDKEGNIIVTGAKDLTGDIAGSAKLTIGGTLTADVSGNSTITTPTLTLNGNLNVNGNTTFKGSVTANGKRIDDTHTHSGVQSGPASTGTPN